MVMWSGSVAVVVDCANAAGTASAINAAPPSMSFVIFMTILLCPAKSISIVGSRYSIGVCTLHQTLTHSESCESAREGNENVPNKLISEPRKRGNVFLACGGHTINSNYVSCQFRVREPGRQLPDQVRAGELEDQRRKPNPDQPRDTEQAQFIQAVG